MVAADLVGSARRGPGGRVGVLWLERRHGAGRAGRGGAGARVGVHRLQHMHAGHEYIPMRAG
jgi:hypothetical protein